MRRCGRCREEKGEDSFYFDRNRAIYAAWCKECTKVYQRERARSKKGKAYQRMRMYGLTPDGYEELLSRQKWACAICGAPPEPHRKGTSPTLVVDHSHRTGIVRGLLCRRCNSGIGYFQDSPDILYRAARYLRGVEDEGYVALADALNIHIEHTEEFGHENNQYVAEDFPDTPVGMVMAADAADEQTRKQMQVAAVQRTWEHFFPAAGKLTADAAKQFLQMASWSAEEVYEVVAKASENNPKFPRAYVKKILASMGDVKQPEVRVNKPTAPSEPPPGVTKAVGMSDTELAKERSRIPALIDEYGWGD